MYARVNSGQDLLPCRRRKHERGHLQAEHLDSRHVLHLLHIQRLLLEEDKKVFAWTMSEYETFLHREISQECAELQGKQLSRKLVFPKKNLQVTHATMLWWNIFTVLDVLLLFVYNQLRSQLGPKAVFYINNVIWFLGLDIYHLYFTIALWTLDIPSIKEVPRRIIFYQLKPFRLEPRRPKVEHKDVYNVSGDEDQSSDMIEANFEDFYSCSESSESENSSFDEKSTWKGKGNGKGKGKVTGEEKTREADSFVRNDFTYIFKKTLPPSLPTVTD